MPINQYTFTLNNIKMNQTHIHLLITHLPIFGSILGAFVLAHGLWAKSNATKIAAYNLLIISSIGAGIEYLTGEAAEETAEKIQGVVEASISTHEDFALFALISLLILGVASVLGIFLTMKNSPMTRPVAVTIFIISLISFGLVGRTGYLGGQIRHIEITNGSFTPLDNSENEIDD
jgi:DMSO reductase anchor subunit